MKPKPPTEWRCGARPVPGAPGYVVNEAGAVWGDNGRPEPWSSWTKLHTFPIGGAGRFVRLVIGGRIVIRSVERVRLAAFADDPASWVAAISGTRARPGSPRPPRATRATPPPALPGVAPRCPLRPPRRPLATPHPATRRPVRLEGEPLELAELRARGERHGRARLGTGQVIEAKRLRADGWSYVALASRYGVAETTVSAAVRSLTWAHLPTD